MVINAGTSPTPEILHGNRKHFKIFASQFCVRIRSFLHFQPPHALDCECCYHTESFLRLIVLHPHGRIDILHFFVMRTAPS